MLLCKICNKNFYGNGYCKEHATSGTSYMQKEEIRVVKNYWIHISKEKIIKKYILRLNRPTPQ